MKYHFKLRSFTSIYIILLILLGLRFYTYSRPNYQEGDWLKIRGQISTDVRTYGKKSYFRVQNIYVGVESETKLWYGDYVYLTGVIKRGFLDEVSLIRVEPSVSIINIFRRKLINLTERLLPEPHASIVNGMAFGYSAGTSREINDKFRAVGISHIMVASGGNIAIVAGFVMGLLILFVNRRTAILMCIPIVWFYSLVTGFGPPIVRAALMWTLVVVAQWIGTLIKTHYVLALTLSAILFLNPGWFYDIGFLLSASATIGIVFLTEPITKILRRVPFGPSIAGTIAPQIGVLPFSIFAFGGIPLLSPVYNLLVLPAVPYISTLGILASLLGIFIEPLGQVVLWLTYPFTSWILFVTGMI